MTSTGYSLFDTALGRCAPDLLVRAHVDASMPRNVVAIGKCAGGLLDGVASAIDIESAFVAIPDGYKRPRTHAEVHIGGHPHMTAASFAAGSRAGRPPPMPRWRSSGS